MRHTSLASILSIVLIRIAITQTAFAKAVSGDTCYKLLSDRSLLSEFYKANPAVHNDCKNLQIGVS